MLSSFLRLSLVVYVTVYTFGRSAIALNVEDLNQVMAHAPIGATQQQLCWLVENSYVDVLNDSTGRTFSTCRFADRDLPAFKLRSKILESSVLASEQDEPWLNLTSYSGPRPFNNETDYCTEIIQYVIQPMYDEQGNHVSERLNATVSQEDMMGGLEESVTSVSGPSYKRSDSESEIEQCIGEACYDVRDCLILNSKCGQCSNSGGGEQRYCDWHMSYLMHSFVVWCWHNIQHTCT